MALRVKNVAAGFVDATGFHPIRRSPDYDPERASDDYGSAKDASGLKYARKRKTRKAARKSPTVHRKRTKVAKRKSRTKRAVSRAKNPISAKWVKAQVRRIGKDIQVMLFPKKRAVTKRRRRR